MSMFIPAIATTSLSALALAGALAVGDASGPGRGEGVRTSGTGQIERLCRQIQCTKEQRATLTEIAKDLRKDLKKQRETAKEARKALADEFRKAKPSQRSMKKQHERLAGHQRNVQSSVHEALMKAHAILTPEQREKVAKRIEKRGPKATLKGGGKGKRNKGKGGRGRRSKR
jgi:Spy/CpxP family protein refolding chaperone